MVVFVCGKCNESLKKKVVEQHFNNCHNSCVSCVDCSKEFSRQSYSAHTVCISEKEKYDKPNFVQKTPKGAGKQEEWTELVHERLRDYKCVPRLHIIVKKLLESNNIPRKKSKVENFIKSSFPFAKQPDIDAIWDRINIANNQQLTKSATLPPPADDKACEVPSSLANGEDGDSSPGTENTKNSQKRKHNDTDDFTSSPDDKVKVKKVYETQNNAIEEQKSVPNEMSLKEIIIFNLGGKERVRIKKLKKTVFAMFALSSKFHKDEDTDEVLERQFEKALRSKKRFDVSEDGKYVSFSSSKQ